MGVIYALCDPGTGEIRYVGQTGDLESRIKQHLKNAAGGHQYHVYRWIHSLGGPPKVIVLEETEDLDIMERLWIAGLRSIGYRLTNMSPGGKCPVAKGESLSIKHRAAISAAKMGHTVGDETRRKLGEYWKGRKRIPRTDDHKRRLSEAKQGKKHSDAARAAMREGWQRRRERLAVNGGTQRTGRA
jgi:hypothetical protein